ncbi:DUF350 domain-containing protein [Paenibacillus xanthanilyticus]|uniref:DUF350 domain-containing protein n=1 Tax=Paenibacillus xanthanilyticus TaxID=1783531 RepID=A0ABV8K8Y5_9BACL
MNNLVVDFISYSALGFAILIVGLILFELTTKNKEFRLIFSGNVAAGLSLGGRLVGLAIVVRAAAENSVSLTDMLLWGIIGIVSLIILFYLAELLALLFGRAIGVPATITKAVDQNNIAVGIMILLLSVSVGLVIAGCLSYDPAAAG